MSNVSGKRQGQVVKNTKEIKPSKKHEISSEGIYRKLTINDVGSDDEDIYTCDAIDDKTSCKLLVEGNRRKSRTLSIVNMYSFSMKCIF